MNWGNLAWHRDANEDQQHGPRNRRRITVITCPTCDSLNVERHSVVGPIGYWICKEGTGCERWKESATAGGKGKGHLA